MNIRRLITLVLALALVFSLAACGPKTPAQSDPPTAGSTAPTTQPTVEPTPTPTEPAVEPTPGPADPVTDPTPGPTEPVADPTPAPSDPVVSDSDLNPYPSMDPNVELPEVDLAVLSGPTGIGAVKLLTDSILGMTANRYNFSIATDNSQLVAGLTNGEIDIATMASNVALNLANKTNGGVQIIALGTLGVLHIVEGSGGTSVNSVADLKGKTVYATGQGANPEYILRYLLTQNGIDPDKDVEIVFAEPAEIMQKMLKGEASVAMLPVPAATTVIARSEGKVRAAIDVTEAWNKVSGGKQLIMTAVVARTEYIRENPQAVATFLKEYAASINYVSSNVDDAAQLVYDFGFTSNIAIAKEAIPQCHLVCITGKDMASAIEGYFSILYKFDPNSIGGAMPGSGTYYVP